jgi:metal-dependent amidase/aminoacylase/carboxypeptidase family protein
MLRVGVRSPGAPIHHLHTPEFDIDERAIRLAASVMGRAILRTLSARR